MGVKKVARTTEYFKKLADQEIKNRVDVILKRIEAKKKLVEEKSNEDTVTR